ncbi:MAG: response regulator [Desulfuromusa sp.]|nr:response regulator [Desulfuromusa sp.]
MLKMNNMEVLLFDNRIDQSLMIEEMLKQIGCRVSLVMIKSDCFSNLINGRYDLVLFDHSIPELDVTGFVNQLEMFDRCMSVAMMVTLPSRFYEGKYGCSGIDYLIFKPFGYEELLFLVREAFQYSLKLKKNILNKLE